MGRDLGLDGVVEHFTLDAGELALLRNKTGATRLGFTAMLKFLLFKGRFPRGRFELPDDAVDHLARQAKVEAGDTGTLPGVPTAEQARAELKVAPHGSMSGYSRDKFAHWAEQGENCNTRETVLERDGTDVTRDDECRAVSGRWVSVYDGKTFTDASDLDIDHMVPLANGWRSGANTWTQEERKAFANDLTHPQLLAVSAASNRSKGDQGPDEWKPPSQAYWCTYARAWVSVKSDYELSVTEAEKDALTDMLGTCPS